MPKGGDAEKNIVIYHTSKKTQKRGKRNVLSATIELYAG